MFTSSSDQGEPKARVDFWVMIGACVLAAGASFALRASLRFPLTDQSVYSRDKLVQGSEYDVVVTGDSRVAIGARPDVLRDEGLGARPYNFGFASLGYTDAYLDEALALFNKRGGRVLLCGLSPTNFVPSVVKKNLFVESTDSRPRYGPALENKLILFTQSKWSNGAPLRPAQLLLAAGGRSPKEITILRPRPFGWLEGDRVPRDETIGLRTGQDRLLTKEGRQGMEEFLDRLRVLNEGGVAVCCFWPPASQAVREQEEKRNHMTRSELARMVESRGLVWVELGDYETFDGMHLPAAEAARFTRDLARAAKAKLND